MPTGLRAADAALIQRLVAGDLKLLMRLGALLQERLSFTEPALQALVAGGHTPFIVDRRLKPDEALFAALTAEHGIDDLTLATAEDGFRVVALADEVGNPLLAALQPPVVEAVPDTGLTAVVATLAPSLRGPVEGFLAARADDQRAAALEQLRYAMPPLAVVGELMPMLLADGADVVRERAIALLVASGAHVAVVDAIRALQRSDETALFRQADLIARLPAGQQELTLSAVQAHLARGTASPGVVALTQALAPLLAGHRGLDRIVDLLLPHRLSLIDLVRALQEHDRPRIDAILARNLGADPERDGQLIVLLASPLAPPPDHPLAVDRLIARGLDLLVAPQPAPKERMALAAALRRLDSFQAQPTLAGAIARLGTAIGTAFDTSVYWLIGELCRDGVVAAADGEVLAETVRRLLREGSGPHLVALLEQQIPALLPASEPARLSLVEPVVESVARFHDDRSRDVVTACVMALGAHALPALWASLEDHPRQEVRLLCAELIPALAVGDTQTGTDGLPAARAAVERLLGLLARTAETSERVALATAAARMTVTPLLAGDGELHGRVLGAASALGEQGIEALGHLAASAACPEQLREDLAQRMLHSLQEEVPDAPAEGTLDPSNQEITWVMDDALTRHTDALPRVLGALERIAAAAAVPGDLRRRILERLCRQWKQVSTWRVVWGPGNIRELGETIARLAERPDCPPPQRALAAEALLTGANQLSIARALARVFLAGEGSYLATIAGRAAARLVQLAAEDYYADDERPDLVEVLIDFLTIPALGKEGPLIKRRIVNLVSTFHTNVTTRARLRLRYLRPELEPDLQARIEWA